MDSFSGFGQSNGGSQPVKTSTTPRLVSEFDDWKKKRKPEIDRIRAEQEAKRAAQEPPISKPVDQIEHEQKAWQDRTILEKAKATVQEIPNTIGNVIKKGANEYNEFWTKNSLAFSERYRESDPTGERAFRNPTLDKYNDPNTSEEEKILIRKQVQENDIQDDPILATLNTPTGKKVTSFIGENSSNLGLKFSAARTAMNPFGDQTYSEALDELMKKRTDPNNNMLEKVVYGIQDSGLQSAIGVLLNFVPYAGRALSSAYYASISSSAQIKEKGRVESTTGIAIDTIGDNVLSNVAEQALKNVAKEGGKGLMQAGKNFFKGGVIEGGTEVSQTILKLGDDYANAPDEESKQKIVQQLADYMKNGGMTEEFLVAGASGGLITGAAGAIGQMKTDENIDRINDESVEGMKKQYEGVDTMTPDGKLNPKLVEGRISDVAAKLEMEADTEVADQYRSEMQGREFTSYEEFQAANNEITSKLGFSDIDVNPNIQVSEEEPEKSSSANDFVEALGNNDTEKIADMEKDMTTEDLNQVLSKLDQAYASADGETKTMIGNDFEYVSGLLEKRQNKVQEVAGEVVAKKTTENLDNDVEKLNPSEIQEVNNLLDKAKEVLQQDIPKVSNATVKNVEKAQEDIEALQSQKKELLAKKSEVKESSPEKAKEIQATIDDVDQEINGLKDFSKQPIENVEVPNLVPPIGYIETRKGSDNKFQIFYRGTDNAFSPKKFESANEARAFFKGLQSKSKTENKGTLFEAKKPVSRREKVEAVVADGFDRKEANKMDDEELAETYEARTQKEKVMESVKESAKTIKQIAEETKIKEPNVRRILGVGAKEGVFERVDKGVYILTKDGQDIAYIETASAIESLPRLASEGFKADMIFLDIPYSTAGVEGGSRGIKYDTLSLKDFTEVIIPAVKKITRNSDSPVVYMYSNSKSGWGQMKKYNEAIQNSGLYLVAKGTYTKIYKNGAPMKFGRYDMPPEGILIFNESKKDVKLPDGFDVKAIAPLYRGHYQTEKSEQLLKAIVEGTTEVGGMVLDPFAGSGVTLSEGIKAGRKVYGIENSQKAVDEHIKPRVKKALEETEIQPDLFSNQEAIIEQKKEIAEFSDVDNKDVGEKIGGAKKDVYQRTKESVMKEYSDQELADISREKAIPEVDYKSVIENGVGEESLGVYNFFVSNLGKKLTTNRYKLGKWVEGVKALRTFAKGMITMPARINSATEEFLSKDISMQESVAMYQHFDFVNNEKIRKYAVSASDWVKTIQEEKRSEVVRQFYLTQNGKSVYGVSGRSQEDFYAKVAEYLSADKKERGESNIADSISVFSSRSGRNIMVAYKKNGKFIELEKFNTIEEARAAKKEKIDEYVSRVETLGSFNENVFRKEENENAGKSYRDGKNISANEFMDTFGFRGVEFGNWVSQKERVPRLNMAYDAFKELANIMGVSDKSISLNGELGFAFGSRGVSGALAHYEPGKVVINITKENGAGTIAHEWWHAFDNYLSRKSGRETSFITRTLDYGRMELNAEFEKLMSFLRSSEVYSRSKEADRFKGKLYYLQSTELGARAFEVFVKEKMKAGGYQNDFLVNLMDINEVSDYDVVYPYAVGEEAKKLTGIVGDLVSAIKVENDVMSSINENRKNFDNKSKEVLSKFDNKKIDEILGKEEIENKIREIESETNPSVRKLLQFEVMTDIVDKLGNNLGGYFDPKTMTIALSRSVSEGDVDMILREEIGHLATSLLGKEGRSKVLEYYESLSEDDLVSIFGKETLESYRKKYRDNPMRMADEAVQWSLRNKDFYNKNTVLQSIRNIIKQIIKIINKISGKFEKQVKRFNAFDVYADLFTQNGTDLFSRSNQYMKELRESGHQSGSIKFVDKNSQEENKLSSFTLKERRPEIKIISIPLEKINIDSEIFDAMRDVEKGRKSMSYLPILVSKNEDGTYGILDGRHRLIEQLQEGKRDFLATTDESVYRFYAEEEEVKRKGTITVRSHERAGVQVREYERAGNIIGKAEEKTEPEKETSTEKFSKVVQKRNELLKKKRAIEKEFLSSEQGKAMIEKTEIQVQRYADANKDVIAGIKNNPYFQKEGAIKDAMGSGFLMDKKGRYVVVESDRVETYIQRGYTRGMEIDSLASEAGFDNGQEYLEDQLSRVAPIKPETAVKKLLSYTDKLYGEISADLERTEELLRQAKDDKNSFYLGMKVGGDIMRKKYKEKLSQWKHRKEKVAAAKDFFGLSSKQFNAIGGTQSVQYMTDDEFEGFMNHIEKQAEKEILRSQAREMVVAQIEYKQLKKTDNLRRAMKLPPIDKMTYDQLREFDKALESTHFGDQFFTQRQIETVDNTDLKGIRTLREAREKLAERLGVKTLDAGSVVVSPTMDRLRYDTALAEKNPFYKMLVDETNLAMLEADSRYLGIEKEANELIKKARKSRTRSLSEKIVPEDTNIFQYLESADKTTLAKDMTNEEIEAAEYIRRKFEEMRDYLLATQTLKSARENYITHIRRDFFETWKADGFANAFKEMFVQQKEDAATFEILSGETGDILPLEKFFQFSLRRTGELKPSENVAKAFLTYTRTFEKKRALDSLIPKLDIFAYSITPQQTTERGLIADRSLKKFINVWINNKKGRKFDFGGVLKQGGKADVSLHALRFFTSILDLGLSIPGGIASNFGEQSANYTMQGSAKYVKGIARANTAKGKRIVEKYRNFTGKNPWTELSEVSKNTGDKFFETLFVLFRDSQVRANRQYLLGSLSSEEFEAETVSPQRLADMKRDMGRWRVVEGAKSIVGNTSAGGLVTQYKTWAIPILRSLGKDSAYLLKTRNFKSKEGAEMLRSVIIVGGLGLLLKSIVDDDDDSFIGKLIKRSTRDLLSIFGALDPTLVFSEPRVVSFLTNLAAGTKQILLLEKYKTTGDGYEEGDLKGLNTIKRALKPAAVKQIENKNAEKEPDSYQKIINDAKKSSGNKYKTYNQILKEAQK